MHVVVEYLVVICASDSAEESLCIFQSPFYMEKRFVRIACRKRTEQSVDILIEMFQDIFKMIHYGLFIIIYIYVMQTLLGVHYTLTDKIFNTLVIFFIIYPIINCVL